jgi:putative transposase
MTTEKFKGYRVPSARLASWDYSSNAVYFITLCTANHRHDFGEVVDKQMVLTPLGLAAHECWDEIPAHFSFVILGERVVMPNHVHGILMIDKPHVQTQHFASPVQTQNIASLPGNRFGPQSQNLASIVRGYKIGVTKFARRNNIAFTWLPRYHDHIIRNEEEWRRIYDYVLENPQRWADDLYYK